MTYDLISFFLIDSDDSPSKFTGAQAEIQAFFHKLPFPIQIHHLQTKKDLVNAIRRSQEGLSQLPDGTKGLFAVADCPIRFPLTMLLEDLSHSNRHDQILSFHRAGWIKTRPDDTFESLAQSLLSPPQSSVPIDCFPPLICGPLEFLERSFQLQKFHPLWIRAGLQLEACRSGLSWVQKQLKTPPSPLFLPSARFFKLRMWFELQSMIARCQRSRP